MSYAGLYGPDETCVHDRYRPNCWRCNGAVEQFAREYPLRMQHPADARAIEVSERTITVYSTECPNVLCGWHRRDVFDQAKLAADLQAHIQDCERVATDWASPSDIKSAAGIF